MATSPFSWRRTAVVAGRKRAEVTVTTAEDAELASMLPHNC